MSRPRLQIGALALAVAALMALGVVVASQALSWDTPFGGFFVYRSGAVTSLWRADWAGRRAGLRVRDVIVAVDGEPLGAAARGGGPSLRRRSTRRRGAARITLDVRHPDGSVARVTVPLSRLTNVGSRLDVPVAVLHRARLPAARRHHLSLQAHARSGARLRALPGGRGVLPVDVRRPHDLSLHARLAVVSAARSAVGASVRALSRGAAALGAPARARAALRRRLRGGGVAAVGDRRSAHVGHGVADVGGAAVARVRDRPRPARRTR